MDVSQIEQGLRNPGKSRLGLAQKLHVDVSQISRLLNGKRHLKVHEVPLIRDYLYGDSEGMPQSAPESSTPSSPMQSLATLFTIRELLDEADHFDIDVAATIATALRSAIREQQDADTSAQQAPHRQAM